MNETTEAAVPQASGFKPATARVLDTGGLVTLDELLDDLDPDDDLVHRHLALISLHAWVSGGGSNGERASQRILQLLDRLDAQPRLRGRVQAWWQKIVQTVDGSVLLSDYGFATRNAFVSEFFERLHRMVLPATPETADAAQLFAMVMPHAADLSWLSELSASELARLGSLLTLNRPGAIGSSGCSVWQNTLLDAITYCTSQIRATGFSSDIRLRMSSESLEVSPFLTLAADLDAVRSAWFSGVGLDAAVARFKAALEICRQATVSVYAHLDAHGISMDLVFRLRQLRLRVLRIRTLLDCLLADETHAHSARLIVSLAALGQSERSLGSLVSYSSTLLAAKVAERSSESGEHYITRNAGEYRTMLLQASGGGAVTAVTTLLKFSVMALGLSAFWFGFWAGAVYAASFVLIQLLQFTLATKQPAMTAPAMAAKLKHVNDTDHDAVPEFVDEITHLVRSQVAAVLGNVLVVFPSAIALSMAIQWATDKPMIDLAQAHHVFESLALWGPTLLFAAFTGVLLFASSIVAGWVENWFVLHRLGSALRYNPRITAVLGVARAARWSQFMQSNISGFAANVSLGFMLGLVPALIGFFGLGLDVRHVTLSAGQLGAACASVGWSVLNHSELWWALASIPLIAVLNLGVSFYLAFRVASQAHSVTRIGRARIRRAVLHRLRREPLSFFWPTASVNAKMDAQVQ